MDNLAMDNLIGVLSTIMLILALMILVLKSIQRYYELRDRVTHIDTKKDGRDE